jgi:NAD(P)H-hydrate epimerase
MQAPVATRDEIRAFDRFATEELGIPGIVLMENAGRQIAEVAREMIEGETPHVLVLAGRGNNGGDAFVVARHLAIDDVWAKVVIVGERREIQGDADANLKILEAMDFEILTLTGPIDQVMSELAPLLRVADLVIDGLLGTGTRGEIREPCAAVIEAVNEAARPVLSVDIPSGLDCDTGKPLGPTLRAAKTVTLAAVKVGFENPEAAEFTGEIVLADIGVPFTKVAGTRGEGLA